MQTFFRYSNLIISKIKDNFNLVVLIPTLLGGSWQLFELARIGTPFLRFFSVTQLIPDGILMLLLIGLGFVVAWMILRDSAFLPKKGQRFSGTRYLVKTKRQFDLEGSGVRSDAIKTEIKNLGLICVVIIGSSFFFYFLIVKDLIKEERLSVMGLLSFIFLICMFALLMRALLSTIRNLFLWKYGAVKKLYKALMIVAYLGFIIMLLPTTLFILQLRNSFIWADSFQNKKFVDCTIRKRNPDLVSFEILYFNDKYIFAKLRFKEKKDQISVLSFDVFMDASACSIDIKH